MVADLNMDMVGRNWTDTIAAIGKEQSDLGATLDRVAAEHPELRLTPIGDIWPNESFYTRSDHYNFARRGVPILFFLWDPWRLPSGSETSRKSTPRRSRGLRGWSSIWGSRRARDGAAAVGSGEL